MDPIPIIGFILDGIIGCENFAVVLGLTRTWNHYCKKSSREKGKIRAGFFIISITQDAAVPRGTFAITMFRNVIELARTS